LKRGSLPLFSQIRKDKDEDRESEFLNQKSWQKRPGEGKSLSFSTFCANKKTAGSYLQVTKLGKNVCLSTV
jgi:hypothetical protein